MANTLITPSWVLKEVGRGYVNSVKFITNIRQYDNQYEFGGAKVGNTIQYRLPQRWQVVDGQALQEQPILDQTVPISLTNQKHIDFGWSSAQQTTEIEEVKARYTDKAGAALGSVADAFAFATVYRDVYNAVGVPGTTPNATLTYLQAGVKLADLSAPDSGLIGVLDPMAMATIANTSSTLFNPPSTIAGNYRQGQFGGMQLGFDEWYRDQNRPTHTTGTFTASTPIMASAGQTGSTISITGWASGATTLKKGDILTIAGVFSVNRLSYISTGRLQQFTVTADTSDSSGATATLPISPSIIVSGPLQTVNASAANGAAVTVWSANPAGGTLATTATPVSMMFHPEAFAFVTADLDMPIGGAEATRISSKAQGLALRMAKQWDVRTDQNITRIDMLVGAATIRPEWAVRVQG
jgi:hypothetical protein